MIILNEQIPQDHWLTYLNDLSKEYQGWAVTVEVLGRDLGDQPAEEGMPLNGISFEPKGSEAGNILVEVLDPPDVYVVHRVEHPRAVRAAEIQPGEETDVQIESDDGHSTIVHLRRHPALPPNPPESPQRRPAPRRPGRPG